MRYMPASAGSRPIARDGDAGGEEQAATLLKHATH